MLDFEETVAVTVIIGTEAESELGVSDLGEFLTTLSQIYESAARATRGRLPEMALLDRERMVGRTLDQYLSDQDNPFKDPVSVDLKCQKLSHNSPLEITLIGLASALVIALILAGGEIKMFGATVKINKSFGQALRDLRLALTRVKETSAFHRQLAAPTVSNEEEDRMAAVWASALSDSQPDSLAPVEKTKKRVRRKPSDA